MSDFESLLVGNAPEARKLARGLRRVIRSVLPRAKEKVFKGWGVVDYGHPDKARGFISLGPQKKYVNLYFMDGVDLPDPGGLLEGGGKRTRHVKITSEKELNSSALKALIRAAAKYSSGA